MQRVRARHAPYCGLGQPWTMPWAPGTSLSGLFSLYPSLGDVTLAADLATTLDGPMQVFRFGALTINTVRTVTNRCRGAVILCDSLTMGAAGAFSMTARGAAGSAKWANQDILVPTSAVFSGRNTDRAAFLAYLAATGYFAFDPTLFACPPPGMGDVVADYASWPGRGIAIVPVSGCAGRLGGIGSQGGSGTTIAGSTGNAGSGGGTGGGGRGCYYYSIGFSGCGHQYSGAGRPWGGGTGGGSVVDDGAPSGLAADQYGGNGGFSYGAGAGNPAGDGQTSGTGGVLIVICRGAVNIASGASLVAAGVPAPPGFPYSGGSSGGGSVSLFYGSTYINNGSISAPGGNAYGNGGAGGAGSVQVKTFVSMGW